MKNLFKVVATASLAGATVLSTAPGAFAQGRHHYNHHRHYAADEAAYGYGNGVSHQMCGGELIVPIVLGAVLGGGVGAVAGAAAYGFVPAGSVALGAGVGGGLGLLGAHDRC